MINNNKYNPNNNNLHHHKIKFVYKDIKQKFVKIGKSINLVYMVKNANLRM